MQQYWIQSINELVKMAPDELEKALGEKKGHMEEAYKKLQEDFQEFVKAHVVEGKEEEGGKKKDAE